MFVCMDRVALESNDITHLNCNIIFPISIESSDNFYTKDLLLQTKCNKK